MSKLPVLPRERKARVRLLRSRAGFFAFVLVLFVVWAVVTAAAYGLADLVEAGQAPGGKAELGTALRGLTKIF